MQALRAKDPHAYDKWNAVHKCGLNYKNLPFAMKKIFKQSVTKHNLFYISLYGDGDSKAFPDVENTYDLWQLYEKSKSVLPVPTGHIK